MSFNETIRKSPARIVVVCALVMVNGCSGQDIFGLVRSGNLAAIRKTVERNPGLLDLRNDQGQTPLHIAVEENRSEVVSLLLELGADMMVPDDLGLTPLAYARNLGHQRMVESFLAEGGVFEAARTGDLETLKGIASKRPQSLDMPDAKGRPPIYFAVRSGQIETVRFLMEQGADIHRVLTDGSTLLHTAAQFGRMEVVKLLLEAGADPAREDEMGRTPLDRAEETGQDAVVGLLEKHVNIHDAVLSGDTSRLKSILERSPELIEAKNPSGRTPLYLAVESGRPEMVALLLRCGAKPDEVLENGNTLLILAAMKGHPEVVDLLAEAGVSVDKKNQEGRTALFYAVRNGDASVVECLLKHGADPDLSFENGLTPLQIAAMKGAGDVVRLLLDRGVDVNETSSKERTALYWAVKHDHQEVIRILREHGARILSGTGEPIHRAVREGDVEKVRTLLENSKEVLNEKDGMGRTPLHIAVIEGNKELVKLLLDAGADRNTTDDMGKTPFYWAGFYNRDEILEILKK